MRFALRSNHLHRVRSMYSDALTVLKSSGRRLTKLVKPDLSIISYDEAKTFTASIIDVENVTDLFDAALRLSSDPYSCVVRGDLTLHGSTAPIRRLVHPDHETGDRATLYEVPRFWLATDWDAIDRPASVLATDLVGCAALAIERLPSAFSGVSCVVCATSSHGIKPGVRVRLWHWLDRAVTSAELKVWLGGCSGIDASIFRPAQVIYTAAPVFDGIADPITSRVKLLPGRDRVAVPAELKPPSQPVYSPPRSATRNPSYAFNRLRNAAARVASAGVGARHPTMVKEVAALAHLVAEGVVERKDVVELISAAARAAGKPEGEAEAACKWMFANVR